MAEAKSIGCSDKSYVVITFKDGRTTQRMYMGDFLGMSPEWFVNACTKLSGWITNLNTYKKGLETNAGYLSSLWDDAHTQEIRAAITSCLQWINLGIEEYQAVLDDTTVLLNSLVSTNNWTKSHPEYDNRWGYTKPMYSNMPGIREGITIYFP